MRYRLPLSLLLLVIATPLWAQGGDGLPDRRLTPGAINPELTEAKLHASCHTKGWTKVYRPPMAYTNALKRSQLKAYGYADRDSRDYEEDHLVPLCLGGAGQDPGNLWPQPRYGEWNADAKDRLEAKVCSLVCAGKVPLQEAQQDVAVNWVAAYQKYVASGRYGAYRYSKHDVAE